MEFFGQFFFGCKCSNHEEIALKYKCIMYRLTNEAFLGRERERLLVIVKWWGKKVCITIVRHVRCQCTQQCY